MQDLVSQNTTQKTIRIEDSLIAAIEKMAAESERDFSSQVRFMLKEYLRIRESR